MGRPKGSKVDPATGKTLFPEGFQRKADKNSRLQRTPAAVSLTAEDRFNRERKNIASDFRYKLFIKRRDAKYWLEDMLEPTFEAVAAKYGGGNYELWKVSVATGEYIGDPVPYNVDPTVYPPLLGDSAMNGMPPSQMQTGVFPFQRGGYVMGPTPQYQPAPPAKPEEISELEDELEDLEKDKARLEAQVSRLTSERDEARQQVVKIEAAMAQAATEAKYDKMLAAVEAKLASGSKDPVEQMLSMFRLQSEMNGGVIGKAQNGEGGIAQTLALLSAFMNFSKDLPKADTGGGAFGTLVELAKDYLPVIQRAITPNPLQPQIVDEARRPPSPPSPPPTPAPTPQAAASPPPAERPAEVEAFLESVAMIPGFIGGAPEVFSDWMFNQSSEAWKKFHVILMVEKPEGYGEEVAKLKPELLDSPDKKMWLSKVVADLQAKLLKAKAAVPGQA